MWGSEQVAAGRALTRLGSAPFAGCEADLRGIDSSAAATGCALPLPVEIGVGDHLVRGRRPVLAEVLRRVCVADQRHVVPANESPVEGRADASVGLGPGDNESANPTV